MLPGQGGEDVTIDVGVGVANDDAVVVVDLMVAVQVDETHVAGSEGHVIHTVVGQHVEGSLLGFLRSREDTVGAVAIELVDGLSDLGTDGGTVDLVVNILCIVGQFGNLVLVVAHAGTKLPLPVLQGNGLDRGGDVVALVLQLTAVAPVLIQT